MKRIFGFLLGLSLLISSEAAPLGELKPQDAEIFTHIAGFNLANYSFDALAEKFGANKVVASGDASTADFRVCYKTSDEKAVVTFFHGELNWGFTLSKIGNADKHCTKTDALTPEQLNIAGIQLGMDKEAYRKVVGKPHSENGDHIQHEFSYVRILTDSELKDLIDSSKKNGKEINPDDYRQFDVFIGLDAFFTDGHLSRFSVTRVESN